jgi:peptidoglycan-N-acetylglucosamine deacetylase
MFLKWIFPKRHWGFTSSNEIYLTFDDGPSPQSTPMILSFLKEHDLKATFFCVGENVQKYPQLFQQILDDGHAVGNHTMHHLKRSSASFKKYKSDIDAANKLIPSKLFRPPYGRLYWWDDFFLNKEYEIVLWSWIAYDFDVTISIESILKHAENNLKAGDILVLHDSSKTFERVKIILPALSQIIQSKGWKTEIISLT